MMPRLAHLRLPPRTSHTCLASSRILALIRAVWVPGDVAKTLHFPRRNGLIFVTFWGRCQIQWSSGETGYHPQRATTFLFRIFRPGFFSEWEGQSQGSLLVHYPIPHSPNSRTCLGNASRQVCVFRWRRTSNDRREDSTDTREGSLFLLRLCQSALIAVYKCSECGIGSPVRHRKNSKDFGALMAAMI